VDGRGRALVVVHYDIGVRDAFGFQLILQPLFHLVSRNLDGIFNLNLQNQVGSALQVKAQADSAVEVLRKLLHVPGKARDSQNASDHYHNYNNDSVAKLGFHE
jgi:hypothetical protein